MILTERGPILLEINTLPGLSKASFVPQQLEANQENLRDFFAQQVTLARSRSI
jgi:D-alanine-D-alanine ligase